MIFWVLVDKRTGEIASEFNCFGGREVDNLPLLYTSRGNARRDRMDAMVPEKWTTAKAKMKLKKAR